MGTKFSVIATPIGNIYDLSPRAIKVIQEADYIFAEDTRHSLKLFNTLNIEIKAKLISCNSHNQKSRIDLIIKFLQENKKVGLVSDAGCPTISDPGSLVIQEIISHGFDIEVIPGASAHSAALMGAGLDTTRFAFLGFLPEKTKHRSKIILDSYNAGLALVIYESPLRTKKLLAELCDLLGPQRVVIARELTKLYECFHRGILGQDVKPDFVTKGECVIIVESGKLDKINNYKNTPEKIDDFIKQELETQKRVKEIAELVSHRFNISKKIAYERALVLKKK